MNQEMKDYFSKLGKKGAKALIKKHGMEHFSKAGKASALKRWGKKEVELLVKA